MESDIYVAREYLWGEGSENLVQVYLKFVDFMPQKLRKIWDLPLTLHPLYNSVVINTEVEFASLAI